MECLICLDNYNESLKKPYSLYKCGHLFCLSCINQFTSQKCPLCAQYFFDKIPCYAMLQMIREPVNEKYIAKPDRQANEIKRRNKCGICKKEGHNKTSCPQRTNQTENYQQNNGHIQN